jgi:hypothetical protein
MEVSGLKLKTGDLILFDGHSKVSKAVKFFTSGVFSHVGILWQCQKTGIMYVWENGDNSEKEYPIIKVKGSDDNSAHLTPLYVKLKNYNGDIYVRQLQSGNLDRNELYHNLTFFIRKHIGKPYRVDLVPCWNQSVRFSVLRLKFMEDNDNDPSNWLCSELVIKTFEHLGVFKLKEENRAHSTYPDEFIKMKKLMLLGECKFGQLECISTK